MERIESIRKAFEETINFYATNANIFWQFSYKAQKEGKMESEAQNKAKSEACDMAVQALRDCADSCGFGSEFNLKTNEWTVWNREKEREPLDWDNLTEKLKEAVSEK